MAVLLSQARRLATELKTLDVCPSCLGDFGVKLRSAGPRAVDDVRRGDAEFWNACAGVLTNTLLEAFNSGALKSCTLHASGGGGEDPAHVLVEAACACLHGCLSIGDRSVFQRTARDHTAFGRRGVWPFKLEDIVPDGGIALVGWCMRVTPAPNAMALLSDLLFVAHAQVFPLVMQQKDKMVDALVQCLGGEPPLLARPSPAGIAYIMNFGAAMALVRGVSDAPNADPDAVLQLTLGHESRLFASANRALKIATRLHFSEFQSALAKFSASLFPRLEFPYSGLDPRIQLHVEDANSLGFAGVLHALFQSLSTRRRVCTARNCDTQPGHGRFFLCKTCEITPYCSKTCQLSDWTGGHVPHKRVCPLIRSILAIAPVSMSRQEFDAVVNAQEWGFMDSYLLARFAITHDSMPMYLLPRTWYFYNKFLDTVGLPVHSYQELTSEPETAAMMDALSRQERWAAVFDARE